MLPRIRTSPASGVSRRQRQRALSGVPAGVWNAKAERIEPVARFFAFPLDMLRGVDKQKEALLQNSCAFLGGAYGNHGLLWGVPGDGKVYAG